MDDFELFDPVVRRSEILIEIEEDSEAVEPVVEVRCGEFAVVLTSTCGRDFFDSEIRFYVDGVEDRPLPRPEREGRGRHHGRHRRQRTVNRSSSRRDVDVCAGDLRKSGTEVWDATATRR